MTGSREKGSISEAGRNGRRGMWLFFFFFFFFFVSESFSFAWSGMGERNCPLAGGGGVRRGGRNDGLEGERVHW